MSILERSSSHQAPPAGSKPRSDRLRVITAGRVGNMDARLGTSGFDVVAVAETEDALIDAVSADEADAIVVEADLCDSLERVRDLAPDALLIVVGDHTPAGALGRIEQGVSGTVMAGLLHALVAEGVGAAAVWGFVPALGRRGALQVPQRISGWLLSAKADLVREYAANAFRDHAELVTAASTVAVTISASLVLSLSAARPHERPHERSERVHVPAPAVEHAPQYPADAASLTTPTPAFGPYGNAGEPGDRRWPNRVESHDLGQGEDAVDIHGQGEDAGDVDGQGEDAGADHGQSEDAGADHGQSEDAGDVAGDVDGQGEDAGADHGKGEDAGDDQGGDAGDVHGHGGNSGAHHGKGEDAGDDQGEDAGDDQGEDAGDDQGEDAGDDQGEDAGDDQGEDAGDDQGDEPAPDGESNL
jgi:hypothetical protein